MPPSLALAHSSLPFPSRRALPIQLPRRLAHKHPSLCAYGLLHGGTLQRPLRTPRRLAVFARASASAVVPPHGEGGGGTAAGRKGTGYRNRFLDLALLGAVAEGAAEAFFRSEIRRRLVFTAALIVLSRVGYFIPLPGFDRRLIPDSYLSFSPLPAVDLGDFSSELKLSFFQLGISIKFQHLLSCRWWLSLCFATVAAFTVSCYSLQYSVYAASYRTWFIFDYLCWNFDWLHRYTTQVDNSVFRNESTPVTEVEPYIPFNINPTGMQPLLTTSYLLAFPSIMASGVWGRVSVASLTLACAMQGDRDSNPGPSNHRRLTYPKRYLIT